MGTAVHGKGSRETQATVLCADVVGSTALGEALDPEDVQEVVGSAVSQVVRLIEDHGGSVAEIAGDGVTATFVDGTGAGADADDAVAAGYAVACAMAGHARRLEQERGLVGFGMRVGVHAGPVVITTTSAGSLRLGGQAVMTATALETAAAPCTLLASESTVQRLAHPRPWGAGRVITTPHGRLRARALVPAPQDLSPGLAVPEPSALPAPPGGGMREERKVVTSVFVRFASPPNAPDELAPSVTSSLDRAAQVIQRYGGFIKDRANGGLVCLFGVPRAREDDAERAVRAALEVTRSTAGVCAGVATGLVVVGPVGAGHHLEYGATGDTMNTAARLHAAADPGSVLVDQRTHHRLGDRFEWDGPRRLTLKGKRGTVIAHAPLRPVLAPPTASRAHPLVGRLAERRCLEQIATKGRGFVVLEAEAGLGKSRLLAELHHLCGDGTWLESRCLSFDSGQPYGPLRPLVLAGLGLEAAVDEPGLRSALDALPVDASAFLALAAGTRPSPQEQQVLGPLDTATTRHRVAEAMARLWHELPAPLVVAVEDVHWAPPATVAVVSALADLVDEAPVVLAMTRRPDPRHASQALIDRAAVSGQHLRLAPLSTEEQVAFLSSTLGVGVLPLEVEDRVLQVGSGNPFFMEELLGALRDQGRLVTGPGGWRFVGDGDVQLPDTIERVLLARIDQLAPLPRTVLDAASIIGRDFAAEVVAEVAVLDHGVDHALDVLVDAQLIAPLGGRRDYTFRHSLVQETTYGRVLRRHRRALHRRVATALSTRGVDDGTVARHWWAGGDAEATLVCASRAGQDALRNADPERAVDNLALAVEAGDVVEAPPRAQLGRLTDLGEAAGTAGRLEDAMRWLERAGELARDLGEVDVLARAAVAFEDATFASRRVRTGPDDLSNRLLAAATEHLPDGHPMTVPVRARHAQALLFSGQEQQGRELADAVIVQARREGSASALAQALLAWRAGHQGPAGLHERLATIDETVAAADAADARQIALEAARLRVMDLLEQGDIGAADRAIADATARIEALRQPQYLWYPAMWHAMRMLLAADLERAEDAVARFHEVGRRYRFGGTAGVHGLQFYLLRREQGRAEEVHELGLRLQEMFGAAWLPIAATLAADLRDLDEAARLVRLLTGPREDELPRDLARGARLALLAEAVAAVDDRRAAARLYGQLLPFRDHAIVVGAGAVCLGAASHHLGLLARTLDRFEVARAHLEAAVVANAAMDAPAAAGHSRCELATLPTVDRAAALALLRSAHDTAVSGGLTRLRTRATTLLQEHTEEDDHVGTR